MRLLVLIAVLVVAGCDGDEAGLRCEALEGEWHAFVDAHQSCTRDDECRIVNRYVMEDTFGWSCDLQQGLLAGVRVDAYAQVQPFVDRYFQCLEADAFSKPWSDHSYDATPPEQPRCSNNRCTFTSGACGEVFDNDAGF